MRNYIVENPYFAVVLALGIGFGLGVIAHALHG
jgi:ElaB/YqjD/DUF883 family membrane-anchored ribosome-binding protein